MRVSVEPELTFRAVATGLLLGAVLCAGNLYMGLKTGWTESGNYAAAIAGYALCTRLAARSRSPAHLETNIVQTTAVVMAGMGTAGALLQGVPAMQQSGLVPPSWLLVLWTAVMGLVGLALSVPLRRQLILREALPFPTGVVTAELIRTLHARGEAMATKVRLVFTSTLASAVVTWLRSGRPALLPDAVLVPGRVGGLELGAVSVGLTISPMMLGIGALIGRRAAGSLAAGAVLAWVVVGPLLIAQGWVVEQSFAGLVSWLSFPAVGLIAGASAATLVRQRGDFLAAARGLTSSLAGQRGRVALMAIVAVAALCGAAWATFGLSPLTSLFAVGLGAVLATVSARAAGQTDITPTGALGQLAQVSHAAAGTRTVTSNIAAAAIATGLSSQVATSLWCLKTGHELKAGLRPQLIAQALACVAGAVVAVAAYRALLAAYPLGSEGLPAPSATMARALALVFGQEGARAFPPYAAHAALVAFGGGVALARLEGRAPVLSPMALGVGFVTPASYAAAILLGALIAPWVLRSTARDQESVLPVATGLLVGESMTGVLIAVLHVTSVL